MFGVIAHPLDFELFQSWDRKYGKRSAGADRNVFRAARAVKSVKAVLHRVLLLFDHVSCAMPQKVTGCHGHGVRETWLKHLGNIKIKILSEMNAHYWEETLINGQSSPKVLLEVLFHRHECFISIVSYCSHDLRKSKLICETLEYFRLHYQ